jgi:hypothetical protein
LKAPKDNFFESFITIDEFANFDPEK